MFRAIAKLKLLNKLKQQVKCSVCEKIVMYNDAHIEIATGKWVGDNCHTDMKTE